MMGRVILGFLLFTHLLFAELKVGEVFPSLTLVNQFDDLVTIPDEGEVTLLISAEKSLSKAIVAHLKKQKSDFLEKRHLLYISDVSTLPTFLMKLFVLPNLKELEFSVALLKGESDMVYQDGKVMVVALMDGKVKKIESLSVEALW